MYTPAPNLGTARITDEFTQFGGFQTQLAPPMPPPVPPPPTPDSTALKRRQFEQLNSLLYPYLAKWGMPVTQAEAAVQARQFNASQTGVSIEMLRLNGGIGAFPMEWWDGRVLNNSRIPQDERYQMRLIIEKYYQVLVQLNQ